MPLKKVAFKDDDEAIFDNAVIYKRGDEVADTHEQPA
jgi:hypothetical protein